MIDTEKVAFRISKGLFIVAVLFIILVVPINLINHQERVDNACKEIGYNKLISLNGDNFCTNDNINLFLIKLDTKGILPERYIAKKINLYNYGEENETN